MEKDNTTNEEKSQEGSDIRTFDQEHEESQDIVSCLNLSGTSLTSNDPLSPIGKNSRTPSGNLLTNKVAENKIVFSPKISKRKREGDSQCIPTKGFKVQKEENGNVQPTGTKSSTCLAGCKTRSGSLDRWINKLQHDQSLNQVQSTIDPKQSMSTGNIHQSLLSDLGIVTPNQPIIQRNFIRDYKEPALEELQHLSKMLEEKQSDVGVKNGSGTNADIKEDQKIDNEQNQEIEQMDQTTEAEMNLMENPQVVSLLSVQQMFAELKGEIKTLSGKVEKIEVNQQQQAPTDHVLKSCKEATQQQVNEYLESEGVDAKSLKDDLKYFKRKTRTLTDVVQRMSVEIDELKARLENIEISTSRKAISISGFFINGQKYEMIEQLEYFFMNRLQVRATVEEVFKMGSKEPKTLIVYLQSMAEKRLIMQNKSKLKNLRNKENGKVYINEYQSTAQSEKRKFEKRINEENQMKAKPLDISYSRGNMVIQGETFKPKISVPTPHELINIEPKELEAILKIKVESSDKIIQDKSIFEGFTSAVQSYEDVRQLYIKMKLIRPMARHIVCAYYLAGTEETYYTQGFCDDGEPGAGRIILQTMQQNKLENRVFFISRQYGGIRMGAERFECYTQAAKQVLQAYPFNSILKLNQAIVPQMEKKKTYQKPKSVPMRGNNPRLRGSYSNMGYRQNRITDGFTSVIMDKVQSMAENNDWNYQQGNDWSAPKDKNYYSQLSNGTEVD